MKHRFFALYLILIFTLVLTGCSSFGAAPVETLAPGPAQTAAMQTIVAGVTQAMATAAMLQPPVTNTPLPTETVEPSATPEASNTPLIADLPSPTATLEISSTQETATTLEPTITVGQPEPSATLEPPSAGKVVYKDNFASTVSGWSVTRQEEYGRLYTNGGYGIYLSAKGVPNWSVHKPEMDDVILEVDGALTRGAGKGYLGLICRHSSAGAYYMFVVGSSDAYYAIGKETQGTMKILQEGTAQTGILNGGAQFNHVRAECIGDMLTLYANSQQLTQAKDDEYKSGRVGVVAGLRYEGQLAALFDNFVVMKP